MLDMERTVCRPGAGQILLSGGLTTIDIRPPYNFSWSDMSSTTEFGVSAEVLRMIAAADDLLAMASYEAAYTLYIQLARLLWCRRTEPSALPLLVSLVSNMSRAASAPAVMRDVGTMLKQVIDVHVRYGVSDRRGEASLHTHLAILLLRLQEPHNDAGYCGQGSWILGDRLKNWDPVLEDWRAPATMLHQCATLISIRSSDLVSDKTSRQLEHCPFRLLKVELGHDQELRWPFEWCAFRLLSLNLHLFFEKGLSTARMVDWDPQTTKRALSIILFSHLSEALIYGNNAVLPVHEYGACKVHWVHEVYGKMRISQADLFATMALILTNLVSSWDDVRKGTCVESTNKSCTVLLWLWRQKEVHIRTLWSWFGLLMPPLTWFEW
jgi:hypothetical protein